MIRVHVEMILNVSDQAEAADGTNEILRDHLFKFAPTSCLLDYGIVDFEHVDLDNVSPKNYEKSDTFNLNKE